LIYYQCSNHSGLAQGANPSDERKIQTILFKFEFLAFDTNLLRTCFNIVQKLRFIANDSFNPVC
jgi:hypothetical protein